MTQNTTHIALILLGGFVGGLVGSALMGGPAVETDPPLYMADAAQVDGQSEELAQRVQGLEGTLAGMEAALDGLRTELADRRREPMAPPVAAEGRRGKRWPSTEATSNGGEEAVLGENHLTSRVHE